MSKTPRQYSLVKFDFESIPEKYHSEYTFTNKDVFLFLGEIPNMPGHCALVDNKSGLVLSGYHTSNFIELSEEET
jgi:hypothetical protein